MLRGVVNIEGRFGGEAGVMGRNQCGVRVETIGGMG